MEKREKELAYLLSFEEDFDAWLNIYRRFISEFPPEFFRIKKQMISTSSLPYFDCLLSQMEHGSGNLGMRQTLCPIIHCSFVGAIQCNNISLFPAIFTLKTGAFC